jgi:hypothetical protein
LNPLYQWLTFPAPLMQVGNLMQKFQQLKLLCAGRLEQVQNSSPLPAVPRQHQLHQQGRRLVVGCCCGCCVLLACGSVQQLL